MADEHHEPEIRISNWTLATGTRLGERVPIVVVAKRTNA